MRELTTTTRAVTSRRSFLIVSTGVDAATTGGKADGDAHIVSESRAYHGLSRSDRLLAPGQAPPLGTHIVTPRRGYTHHGIYVGGGNVVQYGGLVRGLRRGPVEEVGLEQFTNGRPLWVRYENSPCFDPDEVIRRARSRVGEDRYRLLTNNCEHFCEWRLRAEHRSYQVDESLSPPHRALRMTASCVHVRAVMFLDHVQTLLRGVHSRLFGRFAHPVYWNEFSGDSGPASSHCI